MGGYASIAAVLAAKFYKIPVYLHEQNVFPGAVNRFCGRFARTVFLSFEESLQYIAGKVFGNPVRDEIINLPELKHEKRNVLIMGGSQGARKLNHLIVSALPLIRQDVFIYHIIGDRDYKQIMAGSQLYQFKNYQPISYDHQIASLLAKIDLTISRAGATAIAEFLVRAIPMILVPFPFAADDHQRLNAKAIEKAGAALVLEEKHLTPQIIADLVNNHGLNYAKMKQACNKAAKPDAASKIADYIYADNR
jgi:UDP-N-acetylglucosamine--N-acetylmuramyl-(pentapeptide) pyrophosphoryl-undecaprenol N-acetylglucosamine transferase